MPSPWSLGWFVNERLTCTKDPMVRARHSWQAGTRTIQRWCFKTCPMIYRRGLLVFFPIANQWCSTLLRWEHRL
ncbi:hypothetical protein KC19_11G099100 [Ceratodon purpureus]|uniref:Uncharacterized protein n=1 Tax=Ceratodon purpureus TaxID=3225 RepID=A0A8T0GCV5_CERPU|nr:hypothetical protein KC19_11G099100 [Ceratodon purpureus]